MHSNLAQWYLVCNKAVMNSERVDILIHGMQHSITPEYTVQARNSPKPASGAVDNKCLGIATSHRCNIVDLTFKADDGEVAV